MFFMFYYIIEKFLTLILIVFYNIYYLLDQSISITIIILNNLINLKTYMNKFIFIYLSYII